MAVTKTHHFPIICRKASPLRGIMAASSATTAAAANATSETATAASRTVLGYRAEVILDEIVDENGGFGGVDTVGTNTQVAGRPVTGKVRLHVIDNASTSGSNKKGMNDVATEDGCAVRQDEDGGLVDTAVVVALEFEGSELTAVESREQEEITHSERRFYEYSSCVDQRNVRFDMHTHRNQSCRYYERPFSIDLPDWLPSSTSFSPSTNSKWEDGRTGFRIRYNLSARILSLVDSSAVSDSHQQQLPRSALQGHRICVDVRSKPLQPLSSTLVGRVPHTVEPTTLPINALTVLRRGEVTVGAFIQDTQLGKGKENLIVHLACHNGSTEPIKRIQIKVIEEMQWKAGVSTSGDAHNTEHSSKVIMSLDDVLVPGVNKRPKKKTNIHRGRRHADGTQLDDSGEEEEEDLESVAMKIRDSLSTGRNAVHLRVPETARDTYTSPANGHGHRYGGLVKVWHLLQIKVVMSSIVTNNPKLPPIPLFIGSSPASAATSLPPPSNPRDPPQAWVRTADNSPLTQSPYKSHRQERRDGREEQPEQDAPFASVALLLPGDNTDHMPDVLVPSSNSF